MRRFLFFVASILLSIASVFAQCDINLSAEPPECGEVFGGGKDIPCGTMVTIGAIPDTCCVFLYWAENGVPLFLFPFCTFEFYQSHDLVAHFEKKTFDVIISSNPYEGGTILGGGTNVSCGDSIFVSASAAPEYEFVNWTVDSIVVSTDPCLTFTVTKPCTLIANFTKKTDVIDITESTTINIYPNPTTGELRITNYELRIDAIEVYDVYGRNLLKSETLNPKSETVINISHLSAGTYFLRITTEQGVVTKKIIKN